MVGSWTWPTPALVASTANPGRADRPWVVRSGRAFPVTDAGWLRSPAMIIDPTSLTAGQADRRQRVIQAALSLAAEGGYEAVQMRDVAARAAVALGTIYHYFSSKDHLLAATLVEWAAELEQDVQLRPAEGATTLARVLDLLDRTTGTMRSYSLLSAAVVHGFTAPGEEIAVCQREVHEIFVRVLSSAFPAGFDENRRLKIIRMLEHVWFSGLIGWKNGWATMPEAISELGDAAWLLLDER
jgi:AcrR family transcriptional regulator